LTHFVREPSPPSLRLKPRLVISFLVLLAMIGGVIGAGSVFVPGPLSEKKTVVIPHGASVHEIAGLLDSNGVIYNAFAFRAAAKLLASDQLKAGEYEFTPHQSMADAIAMMHDGRSVVHMFTVAEGLTSAEIVTLLKNNTLLTGDVATPAEGSLLPETYRYSYGDSRAGMVARMQKAMQEILTELWSARDTSISLTAPEQAITLASIVEKETGKVAERPRIAGVFYNRLRQNMRLQSDPTVIYAIVKMRGPMGRELEHGDLAFPSAYNTYASDGLPPGPICNPGRAAIEAVLHPEQNDFIYFVADGTGGHVFARDLAEHNQNVTKWNALQRARP
jgi:UPF0755 protein